MNTTSQRPQVSYIVAVLLTALEFLDCSWFRPYLVIYLPHDSDNTRRTILNLVFFGFAASNLGNIPQAVNVRTKSDFHSGPNAGISTKVMK